MATRLRTLRPSLATLDMRAVAAVAKAADPHYASPEHAAWRSAVIARAGHRCQACGRDGTRLFADHIIEISDGGALTDPRNGQALCGSCHTIKTNRTRADRMRAAP